MRYVLAAVLLLSSLPPVLAHDPITTRVTWDREIAPILQARCVTCHSSGGRGPMSLASYEEARPWARAIREEVLARRMPKWHAVRGYGDFRNDPSLSPFDIALITAWVDGGAPRSEKAAARVKASGFGPSPSPEVPAARPADDPGVANARRITVPCRSKLLPPGRLLGVTPTLAPGGGLRLTVKYANGAMEPLLWVRRFDPQFKETYWLRTPVSAARSTLVVAKEGGPTEGCSIMLTLSAL